MSKEHLSQMANKKANHIPISSYVDRIADIFNRQIQMTQKMSDSDKRMNEIMSARFDVWLADYNKIVDRLQLFLIDMDCAGYDVHEDAPPPPSSPVTGSSAGKSSNTLEEQYQDICKHEWEEDWVENGPEGLMTKIRYCINCEIMKSDYEARMSQMMKKNK